MHDDRPRRHARQSVRISASYGHATVRVRLLSVRAPTGARIAVLCRGHGCPVRSLTRLAAAGNLAGRPVRFRRLERRLRPGVVIEVRISKAGEIGKYTRFTIRRHQFAARMDTCLGTDARTPVACPQS